MADISANNWNEQDAANNAAAPNGLPKGAQPSALQPVITDTRGALKRFWNRINAIYTTTGTAAALVITFTQPPAGYVKGERIAFFPNATNTGAMTLNFNTIGAKSILRLDGSALAAGDVRSGQFTECVYDGSAFRLVSAAGNKYSGDVSAGSFTAPVADITTVNATTLNGKFDGDGSLIEKLNASQLTSGTVPNARMAGEYGFDTLVLDNRGYAPIWEAKHASNNPEFRLTIGSTRAAAMYQESTGAQNFVIRKFNPTTGAGEGYFRIDGPGATDGKYNGATIWTESNDGSGSGLDSDFLDGQHGAYYRDLGNSTGTLPNSRLVGNYDFTSLTTGGVSAINNNLAVRYGICLSRSAASISDIDASAQGYLGVSTAGTVYLSRRTTAGGSDTASVSLIADNSNGLRFTYGSTNTTVYNTGNLLNIGTSASSARSALGLGNLATENFSDLVYNGSTTKNVTFPVSTTIWVIRNGGPYTSLNGSRTINIYNDNCYVASGNGTGEKLGGTWRHRGDNNSGSDSQQLFQRTA